MTTRRSLRSGLLAAGAVLLTLLVVTPAASAACPEPPVSQAFAPWGDTSDYFLLDGGDFEQPAGWLLSPGAARVAGSEPFGVTGEVGSSALALRNGSWAMSPPVCVSLDHPTFRFFHKAVQGSAASLRVEAVAVDSLQVVDLGTVDGTTKWAPSEPMSTGAENMIGTADGTVQVRFRFFVDHGTWTIDDVHVDPWRRG